MTLKRGKRGLSLHRDILLRDCLPTYVFAPAAALGIQRVSLALAWLSVVATEATESSTLRTTSTCTILLRSQDSQTDSMARQAEGPGKQGGGKMAGRRAKGTGTWAGAQAYGQPVIGLSHTLSAAPLTIWNFSCTRSQESDRMEQEMLGDTAWNQHERTHAYNQRNRSAK